MSPLTPGAISSSAIATADHVPRARPLISYGREQSMQEWTAADPSRTVRRFSSHGEQKLETLRYWRSVSAADKLTAVTELVESAYRMRGVDVHAERPKGPVVRVQRGGR
jgi:hypothetical protein